MPRILLRKIRTRGFRPDFDAIKQEWLSTLDNEIKPDLIKLFNKTVATWKEHKPSFRGRKTMTSTEIKVFIFPHGSEEDIRIYGFVTRGTSKRWALMSSNWQSKTSPGVIGSKAGSGFAVLRGKKMMNQAGYREPLPGLEARRFEETISEEYLPKFRAKMEAAAKRGIRAAQRG